MRAMPPQRRSFLARSPSSAHVRRHLVFPCLHVITPWLRDCALVRLRADANLFGDFMVPFGTAAIESGEWAAGIGDARLADAFTQRGDGSVVFRDERVCAGERDGIAVILDAAADDDDTDDRGGVAVCPADAAIERALTTDFEEQMRRGLAGCDAPWQKVGVRFADTNLLPFAHNRLPALRRPGWRRAFEWIEQAHKGRGVMQHCARYIALGQDVDFLG